MADRENTAPTEDHDLVDQLRGQGILGPFRVADWAALSATGSTRARNEDRTLIDPHIGAVVADGMGGHPGGELAADVTARVAFAHLRGLREATARALVDQATTEVVRAGATNGYHRLGSTLVALAVHRNHVVVLNVGDSRAYRLRDGELEQLTRDHSVRAELDAAGIPLATAEQARVRLDALTAHIGQRSDFAPVYQAASFSVMAGDRFLLCSDGGHGQGTAAAMRRARGAPTGAAACRALIAAADVAGGRDNATAAVLQFESDEGESAA